jgi:hypothetical protein
LSSILETGPIQQKYFLSQTACAGVLRRDYNLHPMLRAALSYVVRNGS